MKIRKCLTLFSVRTKPCPVGLAAQNADAHLSAALLRYALGATVPKPLCWFIFNHRCRSKQNVWGYEGFLPEMFLFAFCPQRSWRPCFCVTSKKILMCFSPTIGRHFLKSNNVGSHFCQDFAQIFRDFARIVRGFAQIFKDFDQIFDKSKLLGLRLNPLHPRLLHHCM